MLRIPSRSEKGFTLIELLIVVLIIAVLAAIAIPVYLGLQQQGYKSGIRADVNNAVKRVQVALTEGSTIDTVKADSNNYAQTSQASLGEFVRLTDSASQPGTNEFGMVGGMNAAGGSPLTYTYSYDSATGKFTESDTAFALGSGSPSITITTATIPAATVTQSYAATIATTSSNTLGTTKFTATNLPTWLNLNANTGALTGTPPAGSSGTTSIVVMARNLSATSSKTYTLTTNPYLSSVAFVENFNSGLNGWMPACASSGTTGGRGYIDFCSNGGGSISSPVISLPAGTYAAGGYVGGYASGGGSMSSYGYTVINASNNTALASGGGAGTSTSGTFTLTGTTNVRYVFSGSGGGYTYVGMSFDDATIYNAIR